MITKTNGVGASTPEEMMLLLDPTQLIEQNPKKFVTDFLLRLAQKISLEKNVQAEAIKRYLILCDYHGTPSDPYMTYYRAAMTIYMFGEDPILDDLRGTTFETVFTPELQEELLANYPNERYQQIITALAYQRAERERLAEEKALKQGRYH